MGDSNFRPLARQRRFGSRRDSNSDRGTVKGTFWRRPSTTADDAQRPPITRETPILPGLIRRCGDDRRWRVKGGEGGVGALGEIRTPDPRIRSPMLYPAELRARAWARLPDLAGQGQHPAAGPVAAMSQHHTTPGSSMPASVGRSLEKSISANDLGPRLNPS